MNRRNWRDKTQKTVKTEHTPLPPNTHRHSKSSLKNHTKPFSTAMLNVQPSPTILMHCGNSRGRRDGEVEKGRREGRSVQEVGQEAGGGEVGVGTRQHGRWGNGHQREWYSSTHYTQILEEVSLPVLSSFLLLLAHTMLACP